MSIDYEKIGLKCGLEIHQRLRTSKLFCACPSGVAGDNATSSFKRKLHVVAGELGEADPAALFEFYRDKEFVYENYKSGSCMVEMDCEPPHEINPEALRIALEIAAIAGATIPEEIHVMRKNVIDGSNTSGFQRSMIAGLDGAIKQGGNDIKLPTISLEEESAGIVETRGDAVVYRLDRLGIPLIEVATQTLEGYAPGEIAEMARGIGMLLRSTGRVQRGIGTIRQDVNVSVRGGARVEIKGVQELDLIEKIIGNEAQRQLSLIELRKRLGKAELQAPVDATPLFRGTPFKIVSNALRNNGKVYAFRLPGMAGLLKTELCPGKTLGRELADYAATQGVGGVIHSDEDVKKYGLEREFSELRKMLKAGGSDAVAFICDVEERARRAASVVAERAKKLSTAVPEEVRVAQPDGTSKYARPLPGAGRMYPETDIPPVVVERSMLAEIRKHLPESWEKKLARFEKIIPRQVAKQILKSDYLEWFEQLSKKYEPVMVANALTSVVKDIRRSGHDTSGLAKDDFEEALSAIKSGSAGKESIPALLTYLCDNPGKAMKDALKALGIKATDEAGVRKAIKRIFERNPRLVAEGKTSALMGEAMKELRGRADGKMVARILEEEMKKRA